MSRGPLPFEWQAKIHLGLRGNGLGSVSSEDTLHPEEINNVGIGNKNVLKNEVLFEQCGFSKVGSCL